MACLGLVGAIDGLEPCLQHAFRSLHLDLRVITTCVVSAQTGFLLQFMAQMARRTVAALVALALLSTALAQVPPGQVWYCPFYSTSGTSSATVNYITCSIPLYDGMTYTFSQCSYGSGSGDTFIRLYDTANSVNLVSSDDYCGALAQMSYTTPACSASAPTNFRTFYLRQGCYSSGSCSGTVAIYSSGGTPCSPSPSRTPSISLSPSRSPTPSVTPSVTPSRSATPSISVSPTNLPQYFIGAQGASCADTCTLNGLTCNPNIATGNSISMFSQLGYGGCIQDTSVWSQAYQPCYVSNAADPNYNRCMGWCVCCWRLLSPHRARVVHVFVLVCVPLLPAGPTCQHQRPAQAPMQMCDDCAAAIPVASAPRAGRRTSMTAARATAPVCCT